MNILHLITVGEPGGAQAVVRSLAEAQAAQGHKVGIAFGTEAGCGAWEGLDGSIVRHELPALVREISPRLDLAAIAAIARLVRAFGPDIVHLHTSKAAALARLCPAVNPRRVVYTMHGYDQLKVAHRKLLPVDRALRFRSGAVVAVSEYDRRRMEADGYAPRLIPNGCADVRMLPEPVGPAAERLKALRDAGTRIALVIAREARPKRIDLARGAARMLAGRLVIAWIGGEPRPDDPDNFVALGALPSAASYLRFADMFLLPSDHEGAPVSVIEAMSASLPIVASAVGGVPELVCGDARTTAGCAVHNTAEAFAKALADMIEDKSLRESLGRQARGLWERRYSSSAMAEAYEQLYRELCAGAPDAKDAGRIGCR